MLALETHLFFHYRAAWDREQQERGYATKRSCLVCDIKKGKINLADFYTLQRRNASRRLQQICAMDVKPCNRAWRVYSLLLQSCAGVF